MEQHGKNPKIQVIAIIPARYQSVRLEGKLLLPIAGKQLILHTLSQVAKAGLVDRIIVATDDDSIYGVVSEAGFEVKMTSRKHRSGTDRIAEAASGLPDESIILNVQADEPLIDPQTIDAAIQALLVDETIKMSTCSEEIELPSDVLDPNVVKVVTNSEGFAYYFSRSPIPFPRNAVLEFGTLKKALELKPELIDAFRKHTGVYAYRHGFLKRFAATAADKIENTEMLEQLRALEMDCRIKVVEVNGSAPGVDTAEDYERVRRTMEGTL